MNCEFHRTKLGLAIPLGFWITVNGLGFWITVNGLGLMTWNFTKTIFWRAVPFECVITMKWSSWLVNLSTSISISIFDNYKMVLSSWPVNFSQLYFDLQFHLSLHYLWIGLVIMLCEFHQTLFWHLTCNSIYVLNNYKMVLSYWSVNFIKLFCLGIPFGIGTTMKWSCCHDLWISSNCMFFQFHLFFFL